MLNKDGKMYIFFLTRHIILLQSQHFTVRMVKTLRAQLSTHKTVLML